MSKGKKRKKQRGKQSPAKPRSRAIAPAQRTGRRFLESLRNFVAVVAGIAAIAYGYIAYLHPRASCAASTVNTDDPFKTIFRVQNLSRVFWLKSAKVAITLTDADFEDHIRVEGVRFTDVNDLQALGSIAPGTTSTLTADFRNALVFTPLKKGKVCLDLAYLTWWGYEVQRFGFLFDPTVSRTQLLERPCDLPIGGGQLRWLTDRTDAEPPPR